MTVRSLIEHNLSGLSSSEIRIARIIVEKYPVSALGGIEELARLGEVSAPTVTRFVRRLGFSKFAEFQRAIRLEVQDAEASPLALLRRHQGATAAAKTLDGALLANLANSISVIPTKSNAQGFDAAAKLLADERRRVFILGGRWSAIAAQYLGYQLSSLRGEVHVLLPQASGVVEDRIADVMPRDVLFAFDFRRYQASTIRMCEAARARKSKVIVMTDPELSPACEVADVSFAVAVATTTPLDTLVPAIAACDALLSRLVKPLGKSASRRMAVLEQLRGSAL